MQRSALGPGWNGIPLQPRWPRRYKSVRSLKNLLSLTLVLQDLRLYFDDIEPPASMTGERARASAGPKNFLVSEESCDTTLPILKRFELSNAIVSPAQSSK